MQSRAHEVWTRFFASSIKDDLRYTPSDCFETFPFPHDWRDNIALEAIGKEYYEYRAALMVKNNEGLTKTYNRFHDRDEHNPDILKLRELHQQMDRAVLDAYGWTDIKPTCEFLLDYEEEAEEGSKKKKPWRYRWPNELRDEVLARLIALNQICYKEEQIAGGKAPQLPKANPAPEVATKDNTEASTTTATKTPTKKPSRPKKDPQGGQGELL